MNVPGKRRRYVWLGRTTVTGSRPSACARHSIASMSALAWEYGQNGFDSGTSSVIRQCDGGFRYADADEMNTYCPTLPSNVATSRPASRTAYALNWHTT